ncbi:ribosome-binding protein 1a isoform X2 [Salminus brasiliensis]|uniref:ribosome-binding protein 1a isoform X2 n=1 Tax=Salminus brasiliensis TaxID=930266 RepID=UPI003B833011
MDIYDPQTLGIVVFGGFMVISAIGIVLVSTFSMKETSYEEALAKQRQELAKTQPQQRTEKKKKDKASEKKNREKKKKEEKPVLKLQEPETTLDANKATPDHQASPPVLQAQEPEPMNVTAKATAAPAGKPAPAITLKSTEPTVSKVTTVSATKSTPTPASKSAPALATKPSPVPAATTSVQTQVSAPTRASPTEASAAPSPKDKKKKDKKVAKVETAPTQAPPVAVLETMVKEVPVLAVPPVESQKAAPVVEAPAKAEKPKLAAPSKKKAGSKKNTESAVTVDTVDSPLSLPYKTLLSTLKGMVLTESEAQQLIEILSDKAGVQDTWHTATQKGDPVQVLKKQLEEKERQMATAQEDASSAKNRLRELSKELSAEKSKVALVETRLSSQLSKREQEMIALQARMQASYQDHLAETQQLNAKIGTLQEQLEKGPNAQLTRLQQENSILRDALNKATSQTDSKQNAELAKLRQDCARLNKDLAEKIEALHSEEQLRKSLESKASVAEKQLCQLQACKVSSEQALQRSLEEVSEELRKAQNSNSSLQTQLGQAQRDSAALTEARGHLATLEAEIKDQTGQAEDLKAQLSQVELENRQLQEQLGSVRMLLEASQGREQEQNSEALVSELQEAKHRDDQSRIASLQEEITKLTEELEGLKSTANNRSSEVEHLQYSLKEKEDQLASLQATHYQIKEHLDQTKHESTAKLEHVQNSLKEREAQLYSLEEELKQYKERDSSVYATTAQLESLQSSLSEKEKLVTALQQKLQNLTEEADQTKHKSDDSTEDLRTLQTDTINVLQSLFPHINLNTKEDKWLHKFSEKAQESLSATEQCLESQQSKVTELLARLSEAQESQSTLQADCEQYRSVLAETEGMLKTLQKSVEEEESGWRAKVAELEEQLKRSLQKAQALEETAENLRAENQNTQQLMQLLSESESQLQAALRETHSHREELAQVQVEFEQTVEKLQAEQALKQQLSEDVELAHKAVAELQIQLDQLKAAGETPSDTENVAELKERLEKERKLTKDLGQAATKLQQLLRTSQDQLAKEKEMVRILQDKLQEKDEGVEPKEGTSV